MKKKVYAMAAIDHTGQWIIHGFPGLDRTDHLRETGVVDSLKDPVRYFRVKFEIEMPDVKIVDIEDVEVSEMAVKVE